jgi:hypothetical protein
MAFPHYRSRTCCLSVCLFFLGLAPSRAGVTAPFAILTNCKNIIVWQRFGQWLMTTEDLAAGRTCYFYDPLTRSKMTFVPSRPGSWTPLGSAIKWLMYVDYYQGLDRLMAHDVDWHADYIAKWSVLKQVGCGMSGTKCIFGQYRSALVNGHYPVDLYHYDVASGACVPFCASDSEKTQFAHDGSLIVYRARIGPGDVRLFGIHFAGGNEFEIAARDAQSPAVCGGLVAWAEAVGGGFSIVAKDLSTGETRTVAYTTANPPRPQVGDGAVFWQDARTVGTTGLDIYGYDWQTGQEFPVTTALGDQTRLRVCDDLVTWVTGATNYQTLWGANIVPPVRVGDLRATLVTASSVSLAWTSPGSASNPPTAYELRTRSDAPITEANWAGSAPVTGLPSPMPPGHTETFTAQPLQQGYRYFALKARLANGEWSLVSNCVKVFLSEEPGWMGAELGSSISFCGVVTGFSADGSVYCQKENGPPAIRATLRPNQQVPGIGQRVICTGSLAEDTDLVGPVLDQAEILQEGAQTFVNPVGMSCRALGGCSPRFGGAESGPANTWMLVRVWGRVSGLVLEGDGCRFFIDDGSGLSDNSGRGVLVISPYAPPSGMRDGHYAAVEGIARFSRASGRQLELVRSGAIILPSM